MKLYCDNCQKNNEYKIKSLLYKVRVKDVEVEANIRMSYCMTCGREVFNYNLETNNDIKIFDKYKKKVGLLTSKEIKEIREKYHLSQRSFARVLGLGDKTITRYENGSIQDRSSNNLIALANDELNFYKLWKSSERILKVNENKKMKQFFDIYSKDMSISQTLN